MPPYTVPGVYVQEIPSLPPSVASVGTAIPAFIGYTQLHMGTGPMIQKISSFLDYQRIFGGPSLTGIVTFNLVANLYASTTLNQPSNRMFYSLQHYFMNGGGPCFIVSVGAYGTPATIDIEAGLAALDRYDEPTLYVIPDAFAQSAYYDLCQKAVAKCAALGDRTFLADVDQADLNDFAAGTTTSLKFRDTAFAGPSYGAAYAPYLETTIAPIVDPAAIATAAGTNTATLNRIKADIANLRIVLPPSPAMAAAYVVNDATRGVAHAPANMPVLGVTRPVLAFNESQLGNLNVDPIAGKSINVIRNFTGKGTLIWGARTLDGNSNEWRYVSVRRFFNMVEESVKKATMAYVFEPNNASTWQSVKTMVGNYLNLQWREGALMGAKPTDAYFVACGLGETMSPQDVLEGRLIVRIGMAVNRPAEFIILQFSHFMAANA